MQASGSKQCKVCGFSQSKLIDGFYYCGECGTQDVDIQETILENIADDRVAFGKKTKIRQENVQVQMSEEWKIWHAFNFIIVNMADEVIELGAGVTFKKKLLWLWTKYVRQFHKKSEIGQVNAKRNKIVDDLSDDDSSSDNDDLDNDFDEEEKPIHSENHYYYINLKVASNITMYLIYALIYIALNLDMSEIQLSDIMRWKREGRLSFGDAIKYVPEGLDVWAIPTWRHFVHSSQRTGVKSIVHVRRKVKALFYVMDIGSPCFPDLTLLTTRFCKELCLPKEFRALAISILDQYLLRRLKFGSKIIPNIDVMVMACIVVGLKMCFGLDDDYDLKLSFYVDEINAEHGHLTAYRIGESEPTDRLYNFRDWLQYLEYRKHILAKYYYPIAYAHQIGLKEPLGSEAVKDHYSLQDPRSRSKVKSTIENIERTLMKTLPMKDVYKIIPKEDFPASLTPLTAYTVFLVERITDPDERLVLTEDFPKYSLKYACEDLCLKSSEIDDNLITGVSLDKKNITHKHALPNKNMKSVKPENLGIAVIDYDYEDWVKDYRDQEKEDNGEEVIENVDEKVITNIIEELDETENIFDSFDSKTDTDTLISNQTLENNTANNSMAEYGNTFQHFNNTASTSFEDFDPLYFNREELIQKLVLDACRRYKAPIPHEYKAIRDVITRKKRAEEAKEKRVNTYQISAIDILKTYKTFTGVPETPPVVNRDDASLTGSGAESEIITAQDDDMVEVWVPIDEAETFTNENYEDLNPPDEPMQIDETPITNEDGPNEDCNEDDNNLATGIEDQDWLDAFSKEEVMTGRKVKQKYTEEELLAKKEKLEEREFFEPLISDKNENLKQFNYYIHFYKEHLLRQKEFEVNLLKDLPNSLRVVLENCSSITEYPLVWLYEEVKHVEKYVLCNRLI